MNEQNPGDWPDAVHMAATLSRAAHAHMQKRGLACCPHDIGLALWRAIAAEVAAREAAARREGIKAAASIADGRPSDRGEEIAAAIRALLEDDHLATAREVQRRRANALKQMEGGR